MNLVHDKGGISSQCINDGSSTIYLTIWKNK